MLTQRVTWLDRGEESYEALDARAPHKGVVVEQGLSLTSAPASVDPARSFDQALARLHRADLGEGTLADLLRHEPSAGGAPRVDVIQDPGHISVSRLLIDLDRDGLQDERWLYNDDYVVRFASTIDDGSYDQRWVWTGEAWALTAPTDRERGLFHRLREAVVGPPPSPELRPIDIAVMAWRTRDLNGQRSHEIERDRPWRIVLYQDEGSPTVNRVKIDLDRDERFDERIELGPRRITREVAPNDDGDYALRYHWTSGGWMPEAAPRPVRPPT